VVPAKLELSKLEIAVERQSRLGQPGSALASSVLRAERYRTVSKRAALIFEEPRSEYGRWK
jgi:hypothetical protein